MPVIPSDFIVCLWVFFSLGLVFVKYFTKVLYMILHIKKYHVYKIVEYIQHTIQHASSSHSTSHLLKPSYRSILYLYVISLLTSHLRFCSVKSESKYLAILYDELSLPGVLVKFVCLKRYLRPSITFRKQRR